MEELDAKNLREKAGLLNAEAHKATQASGDYVSLTLMFASVLFFGGITGTFTDRRIRLALGCVAVVLFILTCAFLLRLPIYHE